MSRKTSVKFIQKTWRTLFCAGLLGAALLNMSGCATVSGRRARAENAARENKSDARGKTVKDLAGKWHKISDGGIDYAVYAENLGSFETYQITEDGRVTVETFEAARNYDCPVESSARREGNLSLLSDSQLNIRLATGTIRKSNACAPEQNSTAALPAAIANYQWSLREDETGRADLCLTPSGGGAALCYRREN
ncbi:MAG TPA: hypothetical protein VIL74_12610 [Pyrinomonadaceae bacterium]|jgi:hypothetical protein